MRAAEEENGTSSFWRVIDVLTKVTIVVVLPIGSYFAVTQIDHENRITIIETERKNDKEQINKIEGKVDVSLEKQNDILTTLGRVDQRIQNMERRDAR